MMQYQLIADARGREAVIENTVEALAHLGTFDCLLTPGARRVAVVVGAQGCADISVLEDLGGSLGIEVKITSAVNYAMYGGDTVVSQFDQMMKTHTRLIIVTTARRALTETWPEGAIVLPLEILAVLAAAAGLTGEDILRAAFGHGA